VSVASSIDRVKQSIRERLDELETERDQLMRALEALTGSPAPAGGRRGRPPGSGGGRSTGARGKRAAGRRAPRGQRREQVIAALQGGEMGPSAIASHIGDVNPTQVSGLLRHLAADGVVTKTDGGKWALTGASPRESDAPTATTDVPGGDGTPESASFQN
jgi:hypothetical protein